MFNLQNVMTMIQQIKNPQQMIRQMGIPQEVTKSPQDVAKYLLDNGKVTQQQIQQATAMYQQMFNK